MSASGYTPWSVTLGEQPTTTYWNLLGANDASFNSGTGINDQAIIARHIANGAVNTRNFATGAVDFNAMNGYMALFGSGARVIDGPNDPGVNGGMFLVQCATAVTTGAQETRILYNTPFPNGTITVVASQGDFTQGAMICTRAYGNEGFNVIYPAPTIVRTNYIAIGW